MPSAGPQGIPLAASRTTSAKKDGRLLAKGCRGRDACDLALKKREWLLETLERQRDLAPTAVGIERREGLSADEFLEGYYAVNRPVILTGEMADWPALRLWTPDYLKARLKAARVPGRAIGRPAFRDRQGRPPPRGAVRRLHGPDPGARRQRRLPDGLQLRPQRRGAVAAARGPRVSWTSSRPERAPRQRHDVDRPGRHLHLAAPRPDQQLHRPGRGEKAAARAARRRRPASSTTTCTSTARSPTWRTPVWTWRATRISTMCASLSGRASNRARSSFMPPAWWHQVKAPEFSVTLTYTNFIWPNNAAARPIRRLVSASGRAPPAREVRHPWAGTRSRRSWS